MGHSVHGGHLGQVPQTSLGSRKGCIKKPQLNPVKQSPVESFPHKTLAPAVPVVGKLENCQMRLLQPVVLIRPNKSEMLPFGRFDILEARTIVNIFGGFLNKTSCFHTTACRELALLALMTDAFNILFIFYYID